MKVKRSLMFVITEVRCNDLPYRRKLTPSMVRNLNMTDQHEQSMKHAANNQTERWKKSSVAYHLFGNGHEAVTKMDNCTLSKSVVTCGAITPDTCTEHTHTQTHTYTYTYTHTNKHKQRNHNQHRTRNRKHQTTTPIQI